MLYRDCIEKLLQLKEGIVTNIEKHQNEIHISLRMQQRLHYCPRCGKITYAMERTRTEEQKKLSKSWRKYFKKSKYLLLKDSHNLTMEDRIQLDNLFRISQPLKKAYELKQQFELVKASRDRQEAVQRLSRWIMDAQKSGLMEFIKVSFTYQNWGKEILNSFEYPYTNGYIEGCNNRIKVLKRISFGMPRFVRFRRRIMHIMLN